MAVNQEVRLLGENGQACTNVWFSQIIFLVVLRGFVVPHYEPERLSAAEHVVHTSEEEQSVRVSQSHITPIIFIIFIIIIMWTARDLHRLTTGALLSSLVLKPFS